MGAGNSKSTDGPAQQVFTADSPVQLSGQLAESLQNTPQTDSTRSMNLEAQVQARLAAELEKIKAREQQRLTDITAQFSPTTSSSSPPSSASATPSSNPSNPMNKSTSTSTSTPTSTPKDQELSTPKVSQEIALLRQKLASRKKVSEKLDEAVVSAQQDVVRCLREKQARPLDCWSEVERFKAEVTRLERMFVEGGG